MYLYYSTCTYMYNVHNNEVALSILGALWKDEKRWREETHANEHGEAPNGEHDVIRLYGYTEYSYNMIRC